MTNNLLISIDIQNEYITPGRPFYLNGIEPSLENCCKILNFARSQNWQIAHVQHSNGADATKFNPDTTYYDFVSGFAPITGEAHFIKDDYSCYSNNEFAIYLEQAVQNKTNIYIIGYNSVMCCLSTLEEARRQRHPLTYITDASYAKALENHSEAETHQFMLSLYKAKNLGKLITTEELLVT